MSSLSAKTLLYRLYKVRPGWGPWGKRLWHMVPLIVLAPMIVLVITWVIQLIVFSHSHLLNKFLYNPLSFLAKPHYTIVSREDCRFLRASSIWVELHCDKGDVVGDVVAPVAGIEIPPGDKGIENVQAALEKLWPLDTQGEDPWTAPPKQQVKTAKAHSTKRRTTQSGMQGQKHLTECKLAIVEESMQRRINRGKMLFASCIFADLPLATMLSSAGGSVAPEGSPSFIALEDFERDNLKTRVEEGSGGTLVPVQDAQAKALTIQTWVATLLGFMGAAFSLIDANRSREDQKQRLNREIKVLWETFLRALGYFESNKVRATPEAGDAGQRLLLAFRKLDRNVRMHAGHRDNEWTLKAAPILVDIDQMISGGKVPRPEDTQKLADLITSIEVER